MLRNIFANWSIILFSAISVFVLYPFAVSTLGKEQYGVWLLIVSVTGYFALLQLGVPLATVRFLSKYFAQEDSEQANKVLSTNFLFFSAIAVVVMLGGFGLTFVLPHFFDIEPKFLQAAKVATLLATLEITIRFVFEVFEGVLHAKQKFVVLAIIKNLFTVIRVGLTFWWLSYEDGLFKYACLVLGATAAQSILVVVFVWRQYPELSVRLRHASKPVLKEVFSYSIFVLLLQVASRLSFNSDPMVLGAVVSVAHIVYFTIANSFMLYLTEFVVAISRTLMPDISRLHSLGDSSSFAATYQSYGRYISFALVAICGCLIFYGEAFIRLWMGDEFAVIGSQVLTVLTIGYLFFLVQRGTAFPLFMGTSRMQAPTIGFLIAAVVNVILSIIWGKQYGIVGVAWGTTVPNILIAFFLIGCAVRYYDVPVWRYLLRSIGMPLISGIVLYAGYMIIVRYIAPTSYLFLSIAVALNLLFYFVGLYLLFFNSDERRSLVKIASRFVPGTQ